MTVTFNAVKAAVGGLLLLKVALKAQTLTGKVTGSMLTSCIQCQSALEQELVCAHRG